MKFANKSEKEVKLLVSVILPAGLIRPILLTPSSAPSVNQRFPSGPAVIPIAAL